MADTLTCYEQELTQDPELKGCAFVQPPSPSSHRPSEESEARLELIGESLQRLSYQVFRQEDLQLAQQQQMVRLEGAIQLLQEDRGMQQPLAARFAALERGQSAVAAGAQRAMQLAMKAAEAHQSMSDRQDELHGRTSHQLNQLQELVEKLELAMKEQQERVEKLSKNETRPQRLDQQEAALKRLEQRLKYVEGEDFSNQLQKLQKHFEAQDLRLHAVEDLQRRPELKDCFENFEEARCSLQKLTKSFALHDQKMEAIDVAVGELQAAQADALFEGCKVSEADAGMRLDRLEGQIARICSEQAQPQEEGLEELKLRLGELSELFDADRLTELRHFKSAWPELNSKLDRLGGFTADVGAKTESLEVRLDLTRANLETQEQRLSALSARWEKSREEKFGKPQKQMHFDIKALATRQLEMKKEQLAKAEMDAEKLAEGDTKEELLQAEPSKELAQPEDAQEGSLSGDESELPAFGFSMSSVVRRSISGFTGC